MKSCTAISLNRGSSQQTPFRFCHSKRSHHMWSSMELDSTMPLESDILTGPADKTVTYQCPWWHHKGLISKTACFSTHFQESKRKGMKYWLDWDVPWQTRNTLEENNIEFLLATEPLKSIQVRIKLITNTVKGFQSHVYSIGLHRFF